MVRHCRKIPTAEKIKMSTDEGRKMKNPDEKSRVTLIVESKIQEGAFSSC